MKVPEYKIRTAIKAYLDAGGDPEFYIVSKKYFDGFTTSTSSPSGVLSFSELQKAIDLFKKKPLVKEIKIKNKRYLVDITQEEPLTPLEQLYGIPLMVDPDMPKNKFKLIYNDGREKTYDIPTS